MTVVKLDVLLFLLFCVTIESAFAGRVYFDKCDYKGFTCTKSAKVPGKYDVGFVCNSLTTWVRRYPIIYLTIVFEICALF